MRFGRLSLNDGVDDVEFLFLLFELVAREECCYYDENEDDEGGY